MSELSFEIVSARADPYAASPVIALRLRITEATGVAIHTLALRIAVQIEPRKRHYAAAEEERLSELFGEPRRWGDTMQTLMWANLSIMVPGFTGRTEIDVQLPCSYDFEVAANKYVHAVRDGEIPLLLLFSGTIFTHAPAGFSAEMVPWEKEAAYRLPTKVWRDVMQIYFPNSAWIRIRQDVFDELYRFKAGMALPTWDEAFTTLLEQAKERA